MRDSNARIRKVLSQMLEPVGRSFSVKTARALMALEVTSRLQARVDRLASKCNHGKLTDAELSEYEKYIQASTLIGVLQAQARRFQKHRNRLRRN